MAIDYRMIGRRIQAQRKARGLTKEALAEAVGITPVYLSKVENGNAHPSLELLDALAEVLRLDFAALLTGVQTKAPHYGDERVQQLFGTLSPKAKQVALTLLEQLANL